MVGALVLAWVIFFSPLLAVRSIEVQGAQLTDSQEVSQHLEQFQGVPMTRISERDVMDSLGDLPQVRSVHVMTMPNNTLVVELTERVPVAAVQDGASWALVDHEGTVLRTVEDPADLNVPVIEGGTEILGSEDFTFVADVLSTLPSALLEQVSSAQAESNSTVVLELDGGITVRWGDSSRGALKAEVLAQLVEAGAATGAVSVYDVSSPEHPVLE
ncbi:cell division protein FtsQ/DivIB [Kocuria sp.]|uniref:cell division protein FtsQ/DivIB n=1 Tax=Kocuria sp. TaxID=1871328 RepID=UPI0026DEEC4B|nr:cell division protein FtsQ/DivIB [Kocuria sp.]MDO5618449.1 cell division protein FtsQ/DivIB [Kocuria sp.]